MEDSDAIRRIELPALCIVVLVGTSGSGKSTFARRHFRQTEILSSDYFRSLVSDDENDQSATNDAFDCLYFVAARRLARGKLIVIDATNLRPRDRQGYVRLAAQFCCPVIAVVLDTPEQFCFERNQSRSDRRLSADVLRGQCSDLRLHSLALKDEGFNEVHTFSGSNQVGAVEFTRI